MHVVYGPIIYLPSPGNFMRQFLPSLMSQQWKNDLLDNTKTPFLDLYGQFSTIAPMDFKKRFCTLVTLEIVVVSLKTEIVLCRKILFAAHGTGFVNIKTII